MRRSLRPQTVTLYVAADYDSPSSEEERERERERGKVKLHRSPTAHKSAPEPSSDSNSTSSTSFSSYGEDDAVKPPKNRWINDRDDGGGSDGSGQLELPDYYDVIEHPKDFGTVRKKLVKCVYRTFEQFEDSFVHWACK